MEIIEEKVKKINGFYLHFLPSKKFKTINIVVKFKAPLSRETITKRALLPYVLKQGTKDYPTRKELGRKLDQLYGAVLSVDGSKKGNNHIISFRLEVANQRYIVNESGIFQEAVKLLKDLIYNPNVTGNGFEQKLFNREKATLKQKMHAIIDDKMSYANMRLIDEMCAGEAYQLRVHGYEEDLTEITHENLYAYYRSLLENDRMDVYVSGDFDEREAETIFTDLITKEERNTSEEQIFEDQKKKLPADLPREVIEKQNVQQAKLHIGYRTNCTYKDENYSALQVFNGIFGGFPNSKLFVNVREKNSLAYYASSRLESHKGLMIVYSGIAPDDYQKAREIIELQMTAMRDGDFTEKDLAETKELIVNQLYETLDHTQGIVELFYQQVVAGKTFPPNQLIAEIKQVKREEVIQVAQNMIEDTVYLLTNTGG